MNNHVSFFDWLKSKPGKFYGRIAAAFASVFSIFPILRIIGVPVEQAIGLFDKSDKPNWLVINFVIHAVFILFVIIFAAYKYLIFSNYLESPEEEKAVWKDLKMNRPGTPAPNTDKEYSEKWIKFKTATNRVIRQFVTWWFWCWFSWLVLYSIIIVKTLTRNEHIVSDSWQNLSNNYGSLMIGFMFMTLTVSTSRLGFVYWVRLGIPVILLFVLEMFTANENNSIWFSLLSGVIASFTMAAFFGSINSKFINVPVPIILALYVYAAIQPLYVFFGDESGKFLHAKTIQMIVSMVAFSCKVLLFLIVTWILQTGRLAYFIIEESSLNFKRNDDFKFFLDRVQLKEGKLSKSEFAD